MEEENKKYDTQESQEDEALDSCHRYYISDRDWAVISPHLPGQPGQWGRVAGDNRKFIDAVFWVLRTGEPWRNLPPEYGKWGTTHQRYRRWRQNGKWDELLEMLAGIPDFAWAQEEGRHKMNGKK